MLLRVTVLTFLSKKKKIKQRYKGKHSEAAVGQYPRRQLHANTVRCGCNYFVNIQTAQPHHATRILIFGATLLVARTDTEENI